MKREETKKEILPKILCYSWKLIKKLDQTQKKKGRERDNSMEYNSRKLETCKGCDD